MTAFPTNSSPLAAPAGVSAGAAFTPRSVRRATIAELNSLDVDAIRERLQSSRLDDRPTWVRALDVLDYPRAQLLAAVAPSLERKARERGDIGTGGVGKVYGSDVLEAAGVNNRVVKAIGGFAFDLLTDPLTYVGPAGMGLRVASKAGTTPASGSAAARPCCPAWTTWPVAGLVRSAIPTPDA